MKLSQVSAASMTCSSFTFPTPVLVSMVEAKLEFGDIGWAKKYKAR
jgi:hypothetical protein